MKYKFFDTEQIEISIATIIIPIHERCLISAAQKDYKRTEITLLLFLSKRLIYVVI